MNIVYLAPVYKPAIGGGVVYIEMLSKYLCNQPNISGVSIITEKHPAVSNYEITLDGKTSVYRVFPFRAGRSRKTIVSYLGYLIQNIQFILIFRYLAQLNPDVVFIHSSFHNHVNWLNFGLRLFKLINTKTRLIADVRDPKLPLKRFKELYIYDDIVSCSENVSQHLSADSNLKSKIRLIPVPIERTVFSDEEISECLNRYNLQAGSYIFNGSGCSLEKGIKRLVRLIRVLRDVQHELKLVVAGKKRYWDSELEKAFAEGFFIYLGELSHDEVVKIASAASLDTNLSEVDSMPRHTLEVLAAGGNVLLPIGVPEFDRECPDFVAKSYDENLLAKQILSIIGSGERCDYDWFEHLPDQVFPLYLPLLEPVENEN